MKLNKHFKQFHRNIRLKKTRLKRINSALSNLETFSDDDGPISAVKIDLFQQGSVANNTAVIPIKEGEEFDADAVIVLDISEWPEERQDPKYVIKWFANRLRKNKSIKDKVREKNRCVRLDYAGDFHLDIVPAQNEETGAILVPTKEDDNPWKLSDPKGYIEWAQSINDQSGGKFCRIMKMLKHWRNFKMGKETAPKSILFMTLVGHRFEEDSDISSASDAETLVNVMEALNSYLEGLYSKPEVSNPSLSSEDLAEDWDDEHFRIFKRKFNSATQKARKAYDEEDKEKSIDLWQELFGQSYFPKTLDNGAKTAEAVSAGTAYVNSKGNVILGKPERERGLPIKEHRSFGA